MTGPNLVQGSGFAEADPQEALRQRAQHLLDLGRPAEALVSTGAGLASDPDDFGLLCLHCAALGRLDRDREAMQAAEGLIRLAPELDTAHHLYAAYRWDAGHRDARALASARRAAELDPHDPANPLLLGHMLVHQRRFREAQEQLGAALALDPSPNQRATALALLAQLDLNARRPDSARRQAEAALAEVPDHDHAMRVLAAAQLRGPHPHEAVRTAWNAVQQDPADRHKAEYLRAMVGEYLPHPMGAQSWRWLFLPYGIGLGVSLVMVVATWISNAQRWAGLSPELREVARHSQRPRTATPRWRTGLWVVYWTVLIGGLALIPKDNTDLQHWFFWPMMGAGLIIWLALRRDLWMTIWWVYGLLLVGAGLFVLTAGQPQLDWVFWLTLLLGIGLWLWRAWRRWVGRRRVR